MSSKNSIVITSWENFFGNIFKAFSILCSDGVVSWGFKHEFFFKMSIEYCMVKMKIMSPNNVLLSF